MSEITYGVFINDDHGLFTEDILSGKKAYETRNKNMLGKLLGKRVTLIHTARNHYPMIVGYATITEARHVPQEDFWIFRKATCIPEGSKYDCTEKGKWLYRMRNPERCETIPLPDNTIRHGRSWCEFTL